MYLFHLIKALQGESKYMIYSSYDLVNNYTLKLDVIFALI